MTALGYDLPDDEYEAMLAADADTRVAYLGDRIVATGVVWLVGDGERPAFRTRRDGTPSIGAWPPYRFAEACLHGEWEDFEAFAIDLPQFPDDLLRHLDAEGQLISAFVLPSGAGATATPEQLGTDIRAALEARRRDVP